MAEERNFVDCDTACGNGCPWENRKCNIALITGITGQVNTVIDVSCHNRYVRDTPEMHFTDYYYSVINKDYLSRIYFALIISLFPVTCAVASIAR